MTLLVGDGDGGYESYTAADTSKPGHFVVSTSRVNHPSSGRPLNGHVEGPNLTVIPTTAAPKHCLVAGTHQVADGEAIRYADGVIVGYCKHCQVRIKFPDLPGGPGAVELREMAAELLVDSADAEKVDLFMQRIGQLQRDRGAVDEALNEAEAVLAVVAKRKLSLHDH